MAIKKVEIRPKGDGTYSDVLYPKTSVDMVDGLGDELRSSIEQTNFKTTKSGKDENGIFTVVEKLRDDGTLAIKSILSGGTSPNYTTRTITFYGLDGITIVKTLSRTITHDSDGDWISEV